MYIRLGDIEIYERGGAWEGGERESQFEMEGNGERRYKGDLLRMVPVPLSVMTVRSTTKEDAI